MIIRIHNFQFTGKAGWLMSWPFACVHFCFHLKFYFFQINIIFNSVQTTLFCYTYSSCFCMVSGRWFGFLWHHRLSLANVLQYVDQENRFHLDEIRKINWLIVKIMEIFWNKNLFSESEIQIMCLVRIL